VQIAGILALHFLSAILLHEGMMISNQPKMKYVMKILVLKKLRERLNLSLVIV
jgi:hypothetical protein